MAKRKFKCCVLKKPVMQAFIAVLLVLAPGCGIAAKEAGKETKVVVNRLVVHTDEGKETISRNIYGHFAEHLGRCIYGGIWVGPDSSIPNTRGIRNDVVAALKKIKLPVLRWPGGCFADEYHWQDGIGPSDKRPAMINTHWGMVTENNHFGTHEFLDLCEQLGCEPYISGNIGSGTVREMQQWVEYTTGDGVSPMAKMRQSNGREKPWKVKYWAVGNESWGCGGQMRPEYYADIYRRYATYLRNFGDNKIYKIACGANAADYYWTEVLMAQARYQMTGLSLHYYTIAGRSWDLGDKGSATKFDKAGWFQAVKKAMFIEELLEKHIAIMDKYDPKKRVGLIVDEWGLWHDVEPGTNPNFLYQQNSLRDALVAGLTLNIFNNHCDRVKMANIAQTINVLQAMILTKDEQIVLTPTYHVFEMYTVHHDATLLPINLESSNYKFGDGSIPSLNVSASKDKSGAIHISICNFNPDEPTEIECELKGIEAKSVSGRVLTAPDITAHNTFEQPEQVSPVDFDNFRFEGSKLIGAVPAKSVVVLTIE